MAATLEFTGGSALLLSAIGLYSLMAYQVSRRTREIGIRMALGAAPSSVLRQVVSRVVVITLVGLAGGIAAAVGVTRFITSLLFGIEPTDPVAYVVAALLLMIVAGAAAYLPARRAAGLDPVAALRVG